MKKISINCSMNDIKKQIKHAEKQMKNWENKDREQYHYWAGYRMAFIDFFNVKYVKEGE